MLIRLFGPVHFEEKAHSLETDEDKRGNMTKFDCCTGVGIAALTLALAASAAIGSTAPAPSQSAADEKLANLCTAEGIGAVTASLSSTKVEAKPIKFSMFKAATRFSEAKGTVPAFCQVTGSFLTNPKTGKTAKFLATFPANWNGKYMQLGCSGHCGQFYVSNPALPTITVTAQGTSKQIIEKGYATFATDEGHEGMEGASWAVRKGGSVDADYVDDFLYRADKILATMGKEFSKAFYAKLNGAPQKISKSYFNGCSGGGRDAMVVASYFPTQFDGIIAGSPYDVVGMTIQASAISAAASRPGARLNPALLALFDKSVKKQCDALDGVNDGLIQNPAACNFRAERDLPRCAPGDAGNLCFTDAQIETASVATSAVTDEKGSVVQPGFSVSEFANEPLAIAFLSDSTLKVFVRKNDPTFNLASMFSFKRGGPGAISNYHAVVSTVDAAKVRDALRLGAGHLPENTGTLMKSKAKLLMWHNFSDEKLTPISSINWYKALAAKQGGYAKLQQRARLFLLPGTSHCSISGIAPNNFDAISALENWVEKGQAPDALPLSVAFRDFQPGAPKAPNLSTPSYTMPLCKFPEIAKYGGTGDVQDAKNWSCPVGDTRLLTLGESGKQAGVVE